MGRSPRNSLDLMASGALAHGADGTSPTPGLLVTIRLIRMSRLCLPEPVLSPKSRSSPVSLSDWAIRRRSPDSLRGVSGQRLDFPRAFVGQFVQLGEQLFAVAFPCSLRGHQLAQLHRKLRVLNDRSVRVVAIGHIGFQERPGGTPECAANRFPPARSRPFAGTCRAGLAGARPSPKR